MRIIIVLAALCLVSVAGAEPLGLQPVHSGFSGLVFVTHAGDGSGRLFIVEQNGRILISKFGTLLIQPFLDITSNVTCCNERGLLGLAFDPNYASNGRFYVNYTTTISGQLTTRVSRFTTQPPDADRVNTSTEQIIIEYAQPQTNHNAGWMDFGPDGYLYIASGDGGGGDDDDAGHGVTGNGQNKNTLLGKMLRLDVSGNGTGYSIPSTNPFFNVPNTRAEIWAYGLRNPWRDSFDRLTGDLWIADVGQLDEEEVNFQAASSTGGVNYGWRVMEGTLCHDDSGAGGNVRCFNNTLTGPIHTYAHDGRCSITGGYVYRGEKMPHAQGLYFFADYCSHQVYSLRQSGGAATEVLERTDELDPGLNITSFGEDEAGELYIVSPTSFSRIVDLGIHKGDTDYDEALSLAEVLRVVQLYNALKYSCANFASEDGYKPGPGGLTCGVHSADFLVPQGEISLSELLRVIQLYNVGGYTACPGSSEDGFCGVI